MDELPLVPNGDVHEEETIHAKIDSIKAHLARVEEENVATRQEILFLRRFMIAQFDSQLEQIKKLLGK